MRNHLTQFAAPILFKIRFGMGGARLAVISLLLIVICTAELLGQRRGDNKKVVVSEIIDIAPSLGREQYCYASEYFSEIRYIELESTEQSFMRGIRDLKVTEKGIFILTNNYIILRFSNTGKFLNKIGAIGRGPGEYIIPVKINILDGTDILTVLESSSGARVHLFRPDGKLVKTVKSDIPRDVAAYRNDRVFYWTNMPYLKKEDPYSLRITDMNGRKNLNLLHRTSMLAPNPFLMKMSETNFWEYADSLTVWEANIDTVYRFDPVRESVSARFVLKAGSDHLTWDKRLRTVQGDNDVRKKTIYFNDLLESRSLIFLTARMKGETRYYVYTKGTGSVVSIAPLPIIPGKLQWNGLINDLDGGYSFWPAGVFSENEVFQTIEPLVLKSRITNLETLQKANLLPPELKFNQEEYEKLKARIMAADENSNPWIVVAKLK